MWRFFTFVFLATFAFSPVFGQKKELKVKFGKLSDAEIAMTSYEQDPAAPGVVLFDIGTVTNDYNSSQGFNMVFERHLRFKVFKKEAFTLADINIQHHKDNRVSDVKAISFNMENGKMTETKLTKENIFVEEITKYQRLTKFVVPSVKEGSIVDIKYSWSSGGGIGMPNTWVFQRENVPTIWSEFKADVPMFIEFKKMAQGWEPFTVAEENTRSARLGGSVDYTVTSLHYVQEHVPALKTEVYVNSPNDYLSSISFDIRTVYEIDAIPSGASITLVNGLPYPYPNTWSAMGKELWEDVYKDDLESKKFTEDNAKACTVGKSTNAEKVAAIYEHIGTNYNVEEGYDRIFKSQTFDKLTKERNGTAADVNLLFINMLRRVNVQAYPLLISTTDNGKVYDFRVSLDYLNKVITAVRMEDSTLLLVDAAAYPNPIGLLAKEDMGNQGLVLYSKTDVEWIKIQNKVAEKSVVIANFKLDNEGQATGSVVCYESGFDGVESRVGIKTNGEQQAVQEHFKEWATDGEITGLKLTNHDKWNEASVKMEFQLTTTAFSSLAGDKIYLSPMLGLGLHENPFKNPDRRYNIDLGPISEEQYTINFTIPDGYKVESMPKSAKMAYEANEINFDYLTETNGNTLKFSVKLKQKTDYVLSTGYPQLQQFFGEMASKMEEQVVLTKL